MLSVSFGSRGTDQQFLNTIHRNSARTNLSLERLATGKRINRPSDDPPGFIAAQELHQQLDDIQAKLKGISTSRAQNHIQQSGLSDIQDALLKIRDRVLANSDGFLTADQQKALNTEVDEAIKSIDRIVEYTNGVSAKFGAGQISTPIDGNPNIDDVDRAASNVARERAVLGADEHTHLDTFQQIYQDETVITQQALSEIEDTDYAAESSALVQSRILLQAAITAMQYSARQQIDQIKHLIDQTA